MYKFLFWMVFQILFSMEAIASPISVEDAIKMPEAEVVANLADSHPAVLYAYARRLFESNHKDDAVFWLYAGQLRYRYLLTANPSLPEDGEPALLASLNASIGQSINEWAGGSPKAWAASIDKALAWDYENANPTTPKDKYAKALEDTRKGLTELRDLILKSEDQIRSERQSNGLVNR